MKRRRPLFVLGIDGLPAPLLERWKREGRRSALSRIGERYGLRSMDSSLPEVSSVSWTTFFTGKNPGEHGLFGFYDLDPKGYTPRFPTFPGLSSKPFWEEEAARGGRSVVLNVPSTYPARPFPGELVSGFVATEMEKAVYPSTLLPLLREERYSLDNDIPLAQKSPQAFLKSLEEDLKARWRVFERLSSRPWDLFFFVVTETDRLQHFFWEGVEGRGPWAEGVESFYSLLDSKVGALVEGLEAEKIPFLLLSDHGFDGVKEDVYLNPLLERWGYLDRGGGREFASLREGTTAFALDPGRIYLHRESRFSRGRVRESECEALARELASRFLEWEENGVRPISRVFFRDEVYRGEFTSQAPDLLLLPGEGYDLKAGITKSLPLGSPRGDGRHTRSGAFLIDGGVGLRLPVDPDVERVGAALRLRLGEVW